MLHSIWFVTVLLSLALLDGRGLFARTSNKQGMSYIGDCDKQMFISVVATMAKLLAIGYRVQKGFRASYHQICSNCSFQPKAFEMENRATCKS
jgi:hypothetical protein